MCGIVGRFHIQNTAVVDRALLERMRDTMTHRGPDGSGVWVNPSKRIGLAHRRLAIIDLSRAASQPMHDDDAVVCLVFNGEIYNHADLRKELEQKGVRFRTSHSDTEVILHAYKQWGIECIHRFRGMFAIALWDEQKKILWLIRDRLGIKPLYYTLHDGVLSFASEIKAILADQKISRTVHKEALYHYFSFLTTPAPLTMFAGIQKLAAGTLLRVTMDGVSAPEHWWDPWKSTIPLTSKTDEEITEQLLCGLRESVALRKISDVPVGVFLSGGIDSSTNVALFSEGNNKRVKTFSVGYGDKAWDYPNELPYARLVANFFKTEHHEYIITEDDARAFISRMVWHQDEPIADPVCIPIYFLSKLARDNGVIVCQLGEGSDELFFGYDSWRRIAALQRVSDHFPFPAMKRFGLRMLDWLGSEQTLYYEWLRRAADKTPLFWGGAEAFTERQKTLLLSASMREQLKGLTSWDALAPIYADFQRLAWEKTPLHWMTYLDLRLRLPELLLMRVDKMSMAVALEARVPFLDHRFVAFALSVPSAVKMRGWKTKSLLKRAVRGIIPDAIIDRKKVGFSAPMHSWVRSTLGASMRESINAFCSRTDFFNKDYIDHLFQSGESFRLWFLYNFVLWHECWIENKSDYRP